MPTLEEVNTPVTSPANTLTRTVGTTATTALNGHHSKESSLKESTVPSDMVQFDHQHQPLPKIDMNIFSRGELGPYQPDPNLKRISLDFLSLVGKTASAVKKDLGIFYDSEILAVIHRYKLMSSGLVETKVWAWIGRKAQLGEAESNKLQQLAKQYGTTLVSPATLFCSVG